MLKLLQYTSQVPQFSGKLGEEKSDAITKEEKIANEINLLESDIDKILKFEELKGLQTAFIIIDKTKSRANVYKAGKIIDSFEVAVGETTGDNLNTASYNDGVFSITGRTTPPGLYYTSAPYDLNIKNREDFEKGTVVNCLVLNGVQHPVDFKDKTTIGLHQIPKSHPERLNMLDIRDSRRSMTTGCVNFMPEDFYRLADEINPKGTAVYILPEEIENKLEVISLPKGLWMKTKYADTERENTFIAAMKKFFKLT